MSNQSARQASVRAVTGTTRTYEGDWHALFTSLGIPEGDFNGRFLQWLNMQIPEAKTNLVDAMASYAINVAQVSSWNEVRNIGVSYDPDALALFARATTPFTVIQKNAYNAAILEWKASGAWPKLIGCQCYTTQDGQSANLDIKDPLRVATGVNVPTHIPFGGYSSDGSSSYVRTEINTSALAQDNHSIGVISGITAANSGLPIGTSQLLISPFNAVAMIRTRSASSTSQDSAVGSITTGRWSTALSRGDSGSYRVYRDGVLLETETQASSALFTDNRGDIIVCAFNNSGTISSYAVPPTYGMWAGTDMTDAQVASMHAGFRTIMNAVGFSIP